MNSQHPWPPHLQSRLNTVVNTAHWAAYQYRGFTAKHPDLPPKEIYRKMIEFRYKPIISVLTFTRRKVSAAWRQVLLELMVEHERPPSGLRMLTVRILWHESGLGPGDYPWNTVLRELEKHGLSEEVISPLESDLLEAEVQFDLECLSQRPS